MPATNLISDPRSAPARRRFSVSNFLVSSMVERSTVKEVIREVTVRARPHDEQDTHAMLLFTNLRNQLATTHLTSPDVADFPLRNETLGRIQATLENFQGHTAIHVNAALQYLNTQKPPSAVQRLHQGVRTLCHNVLKRSKPQERPVEEPILVPSNLD